MEREVGFCPGDKPQCISKESLNIRLKNFVTQTPELCLPEKLISPFLLSVHLLLSYIKLITFLLGTLLSVVTIDTDLRLLDRRVVYGIYLHLRAFKNTHINVKIVISQVKMYFQKKRNGHNKVLLKTNRFLNFHRKM